MRRTRRMKSKVATAIILCVLLGTATATAILAQETTGGIQGTIQDPQGLPINGAIVDITSPALIGKKTLVTRGVWRLTAASDPMPAGEIRTKLFGNAWRFAPGHSLKLEVSQTDVPSFRPDNLPSSITFTDARLEVPVRSP